MKRIKSFNDYVKLNEKQGKLFPEYEKDFPDNPKELGNIFINKFKTTKTQSDNRINSFEEAHRYLSDFSNLKKSDLSNILSTEEDTVINLILDTDIWDIGGVIKDFVYWLNISKEEEAINVIDDYDTKETSNTLFTDLLYYAEELTIYNFIEYLVQKKPSFLIKNYLLTEYYDKLLYWVNESSDKFIYRAITVPDKIEDLEKFLDNYDSIGHYWSYEESGAEAHSGIRGNKNTIFLKAKVDATDINWDRTFDKSLYALSDEREIELIKNSTIEIYQISFESRNVNLKNKFTKDSNYFKDVLGLSNHTADILANNNVYTIDLHEEPVVLKV